MTDQRYMGRILAVLLCLTLIQFTSAQSLRCDDGVLHWEADFSLGLNNDGYQTDVGVSYFPVQYVGIKTMLGYASELGDMESWWNEDYYSDDPDTTIRFKFTPSFVLRSPELFRWKKQDGGFYLFAEPGLILSPRASGSDGAQWLNKCLRVGFNFRIDRTIFYIGYGVTDFSLYSGFRAYDYGNPPSNNYTTHSVFIGGAYKF